MIKLIHPILGASAGAVIALFILSSGLAGLFGTGSTIVEVRSLIVMPGLFVLIPLLIGVGATGFHLAKHKHKEANVIKKKKRMAVIAAIGLLVLLPCALVLDFMAGNHQFNDLYTYLKFVELLAGGINLYLIFCNWRDGTIMTGRRRVHGGKRRRKSRGRSSSSNQSPTTVVQKS